MFCSFIMLQAIGHCLESAQNHPSILSVEYIAKQQAISKFVSCFSDCFYYASILTAPQHGILTDVVEFFGQPHGVLIFNLPLFIFIYIYIHLRHTYLYIYTYIYTCRHTLRTSILPNMEIPVRRTSRLERPSKLRTWTASTQNKRKQRT